MQENCVLLINWKVFRDLGCGGDPICLGGTFINHPSMQGFGIPGTFREFNREERTAVSLSGKKYKLEQFSKTGFAETEEQGLNWIEENWVKK